MAQQQSNINIAAPGFAGVNTQSSPTQLGPEFASVADNCIIDRYGRVGVRKGFEPRTLNPEILNGNPLETIHVHATSQNIVFACGDGKVFVVNPDDSLTNITPASTIVTTDQWTIISFNRRCYFFGEGNTTLVFDDDTAQLTHMEDHPSFSGSVPAGHIALGAFGRLWVADGDIVRWSDTLNGVAWSGGAVGQVDLNLVWPNGYDEVTALSEHNNFLVIFGRKSIVLYQGADDPAQMSLADAISGLGCLNQFAVQSTGKDLMFLDYSGLRSLGRTIQEKSVPIGDISANVRNDFKQIILNELAEEDGLVRLLYVDSESFLVASFTQQSIIYCFDMRGFLADGSARTTIWPSTQAWAGDVDPTNGQLLVGGYFGISQYAGYLDGPNPIPLRYYSNPLEFGQPVNLKMLKQVDVTAIGGTGINITLAWAYNYSASFKKKVKQLTNAFLAQFGISEYNVFTSEYSDGAVLETQKFNTSGSGTNVTIGIEAEIQGDEFSIQALNFQALIGRMI